VLYYLIEIYYYITFLLDISVHSCEPLSQKRHDLLGLNTEKKTGISDDLRDFAAKTKVKDANE